MEQKVKAIPHNSKCRYGERGAEAAKPKAQIILDAAKVSAASGGNSEPKQGQRSQSARGFCPRSTMRVPQLDIIEHFGNADAVPQPPERCLSRQAGIVRCCLNIKGWFYPMQIEQLFDFLHRSVSPFHAVHTAAQLLDAAGYTRLEEAEYWNLEPEHGYYVTRNESSIIAWRVPAHAIGGWRIAASHSDSPTWRIKNTNVNAAGCIKLNVEGYGGMIMSTWLDRPLSAAGRVLVRDEAAGTLESRLVDLDRDLLVIPSLAIHMDRTLNSGHAFNPQVDMQPLYGLEGSKPFPALLAEAASVKEEDIVDFDLSLYTRQAPTRIGPDGELFMAPRIDDLECAATTLYGFLDAAPETDSACAPVWAMFDNEEVGSSTRQGADSSFLRDVLDRILNAIPHSAQAQAQAFANSFVLSADNAHAVHPNFADKADPCNKVILGKGVVVKVNASQKYTTSGLTGAIFKEICRKNNVPVQVFANRADLPGGSTLGNLQSHTVPVPMVDIGLAQLAMHSAVETAAVADADAMVRAVAGFYRVHLRSLGDARYTLE